jgi:hypothetical protein
MLLDNQAQVILNTWEVEVYSIGHKHSLYWCGIVIAWRNNHVLNFYTNIYCCYSGHAEELFTTTKTRSQYFSLLCLH